MSMFDKIFLHEYAGNSQVRVGDFLAIPMLVDGQTLPNSRSPPEIEIEVRRLLAIGAVELAQITVDAPFNLRLPPRHLDVCEVAIAVVHRLELAAVDRHARILQEAHVPT